MHREQLPSGRSSTTPASKHDDLVAVYELYLSNLPSVRAACVDAQSMLSNAQEQYTIATAPPNQLPVASLVIGMKQDMNLLEVGGRLVLARSELVRALSRMPWCE